MKKDSKLNIRLTNKEKNLIEEKAKKYKMTMTEFVIKSCLNNNIVIIDGLDKVDTELRRIGNNINQLTRLANERIIQEVNLKEVRIEMNQVWLLLRQLVQMQT